jgi:hypothetical protein
MPSRKSPECPVQSQMTNQINPIHMQVCRRQLKGPQGDPYLG